MSGGYQRRYELDWLRVMAFGVLIFFHTGMMFNTWGWHVKNNVTVEWIEIIMAFFNQWRMPLLFFISGAAVWFMLEKYSTIRFVGERHKRLLMPLIVGMMIVIPPQVYYERLFQGATYSFAEFYKTIFTFVPYPEGNLSWHHLWYLPYIFVYSLITIPLFLFLKSSGRKYVLRLQGFLSRGKRMYTPFLLIAVSEVCLRPFWPDNRHTLIDDWALFTGMLIVFCLGFLFADADELWESIARYRFRTLGLGLITFTIIATFWELDIENPPLWMMTIYRPIRSLNIWLWILTCLGFARRYLTFGNRFLAWANEAVYPFYIFHQTITVIVGFYLAPLDWPVGLKFLLLAAATFGGSALLYEIVRRIRWLRPLFGLKMNPAHSGHVQRAVPVPVRQFSSMGSE